MHNTTELFKSAKLVIAIVTLINLHTLCFATKLTVAVRTTSGPVRGKILNTVNSMRYAAFKGIRYAEPPLGYLRFKPPVAVTPRKYVFDAFNEGDDCIQYDAENGVTGSEDCLFINVYTPVTDLADAPTELKPVMFWIHGGGFSEGTSSIKTYRPDYLLEKGVVYVASNYRLGPFGFLSLSHPNATGNAGLKDQLLALKWVKANIAKFGGNPSNVTIFGQSAGSASVGYHVLSDASAGLFHGAISMSGVPMTPWLFIRPSQAMARAVRLGALIGTSSTEKETLLKSFYIASAAQLVTAANKIFLGMLAFVPTLEDPKIATEVFLDKCSVHKYKTGNFTKVSQMLGFADKETMSFTYLLKPFVNVVNDTLQAIDDFSSKLPSGLGIIKKLINTSTKIISKLSQKAMTFIVDETTDLLFKTQIDLTQKYIASRNGNNSVYYYYFTYHKHKSPQKFIFNTTLTGATHADDLDFIFYIPRANYSTDPSDSTRRIINRVSTMWTNFAKYGNPTPHWINDSTLDITWPNSGSSGTCLEIGDEFKVGPRPTNIKTKVVQSAYARMAGVINGC